MLALNRNTSLLRGILDRHPGEAEEESRQLMCDLKEDASNPV